MRCCLFPYGAHGSGVRRASPAFKSGAAITAVNTNSVGGIGRPFSRPPWTAGLPWSIWLLNGGFSFYSFYLIQLNSSEDVDRNTETTVKYDKVLFRYVPIV